MVTGKGRRAPRTGGLNTQHTITHGTDHCRARAGVGGRHRREDEARAPPPDAPAACDGGCCWWWGCCWLWDGGGWRPPAAAAVAEAGAAGPTERRCGPMARRCMGWTATDLPACSFVCWSGGRWIDFDKRGGCCRVLGRQIMQKTRTCVRVVSLAISKRRWADHHRAHNSKSYEPRLLLIAIDTHAIDDRHPSQHAQPHPNTGQQQRGLGSEERRRSNSIGSTRGPASHHQHHLIMSGLPLFRALIQRRRGRAGGAGGALCEGASGQRILSPYPRPCGAGAVGVGAGAGGRAGHACDERDVPRASGGPAVPGGAAARHGDGEGRRPELEPASCVRDAAASGPCSTEGTAAPPR